MTLKSGGFSWKCLRDPECLNSQRPELLPRTVAMVILDPRFFSSLSAPFKNRKHLFFTPCILVRPLGLSLNCTIGAYV